MKRTRTFSLLILGLLGATAAGAASYTRFKDLIVSGSQAIGTTAAPNSKSVLELSSTTKGFLPPRMTTVQRDAIGSPATGLVIFNTTTGRNDVYNGSAWVEEVDASTAQTLSSKTLTSPVINSGTFGTSSTFTSPVTITEQATPLTPAVGDVYVYPKSDGKLYKMASDGAETAIGSGSGSGGSGINVLENADWETNSNDWTASGGTYTRTTTAANVGFGSGAASWDASGAQTLTSDQVSVPVGLYGQSCLGRVYVKGGDSNLTLRAIDGSSNVIDSTSTTLSTYSSYQPVSVSFVCPSSGTFALQVVAGADAAIAYFDNAHLGSNFLYASGVSTTPLENWTPTGSWTGNVTYTGTKRRNGEYLEGWIRVTASGGAPTPAVGLSIDIPAGLTIDTSKFPASSDEVTVPNSWAKARNNATATYALLHVVYGTTTTIGVNLPAVTSHTGTVYPVDATNVTPTAPFSFGDSDYIELGFRLPIVGWTNGQDVYNFEVNKLPTVQTFTSGSGTYTKPAGVKWIRVRMVGGGGGGAGSGTAAGSAAGSGGNTTFGSSLLAANGGSAGTWNTTPAAGGSSSLGTGPIGMALTGQSGGASPVSVSTSVAMGGPGGSTPFGGGGVGGGANFSAGAAVANTGAGGGGASSTSGRISGGGGAAGGFLDAIITSPSATYAYAVGIAGSAGGAGTSGSAGAAGAAGIIVVEEYYGQFNMPVVINSVSTSSAGQERMERVAFGGATEGTNNCGSSPCTIYRQSGDWVSSVTRSGAGVYSVNFTAGKFSAIPTCFCSSIIAGTGPGVCGRATFATTSSVAFAAYSPADVSTDSSMEVVCMGPR